MGAGDVRVPWLTDCLRAAGLQVQETPGWKGRGRDLVSVQAVICHHTATPPSMSAEATSRLLVEGRPDLAGPLCQLGLDRDGTYWTIADGHASHNGFGTYGNAAIGIEAYNDGKGEPWGSMQITAYQLGVAALLEKLTLPTDRVLGHKESDPDRKIDPAGIDMGAFRQEVGKLLHTSQKEDELTADDFRYFDLQFEAIKLRLGEMEAEIEEHRVTGITRLAGKMDRVWDVLQRFGRYDTPEV